MRTLRNRLDLRCCNRYKGSPTLFTAASIRFKKSCNEIAKVHISAIVRRFSFFLACMRTYKKEKKKYPNRLICIRCELFMDINYFPRIIFENWFFFSCLGNIRKLFLVLLHKFSILGCLVFNYYNENTKDLKLFGKTRLTSCSRCCGK